MRPHHRLWLLLLAMGCSTTTSPSKGQPAAVCGVEICDGIDNDCDGEVDEDPALGPRWFYDGDGDGVGGSEQRVACQAPPGHVALGGDCDDADDGVSPGADEVCDGVDNDCDGEVDEGLDGLWFADLDGDGAGDPSESRSSCPVTGGWVANASDCDDSDGAVFPGATEWCNQVDDDCDGAVDEPGANGAIIVYRDGDGDGYGDPAQDAILCSVAEGWSAEDSDCDDRDAAVYPGAPERCNGLDDDCDGAVDDNIVTDPWYADSDGDGFGDPSDSVDACVPLPGRVDNALDCDDSSAMARPGGAEFCDGLDNDCDGQVDGPSALDVMPLYTDDDGDGYGVLPAIGRGCEAGPGESRWAGDCAPADDTVHPGAKELCGDGVDNDCSGNVDGSDAVDAVQWYPDGDGDGHGAAGPPLLGCDPGPGWVRSSDDCDDRSALAQPGGVEVCDGFDNDCNGIADGPDALDAPSWYVDLDADGYGDPSNALISCLEQAGRVTQGGDCDDTDSAISPAAVEVCDGVDNDCSGQADQADAVDVITLFIDADGDGYGQAPGVLSCPGVGLVARGGDCDDSAAAVNPAVAEVCGDAIDNNCSGTSDGADAVDAKVWWRDKDGDGYGAASAPQAACVQPADTATNDRDCDDGEPTDFPGAVELCDGRDNDCDGLIDQGAAPLKDWFIDGDGDGVGDSGRGVEGCSAPTPWHVGQGGDCDDLDPARYPGNLERCDGVDDDCDPANDMIVGESDVCAGDSCLDVHLQRPNADDGIYWVAPLGAPLRVVCDMRWQGGGWTLIGKGRQGWVWDDAGQSTADALLLRSDPAVAFLPAATVDGLLAKPLDTALDGVRVYREELAQEMIWDFTSSPNFSWLFDAGSGIPIDLTIVGFGIVSNNTRDNWPTNDLTRVFTWAWNKHNNVRGFATGTTQCTRGWQYTNECHVLPHTTVWVRE